MRRHDNVVRIVHWELSGAFQLKREEKWYERVPESVIENEDVKLLWDFNIQCNHTVVDTVVVKEKECKIIDIAIPADNRVKQKEDGRVEKYDELKRELKKIWSLKKAEAIPIIISALGVVTETFE